jgi:hypothetical protein
LTAIAYDATQAALIAYGMHGFVPDIYGFRTDRHYVDLERCVEVGLCVEAGPSIGVDLEDFPVNISARRMNALAKQLGCRRYLEVGVFEGTTFHDVDIEERTAVDVAFAFDIKPLENERTRFFSQKSDDFFDAEPIQPPYDLVFIDGLHRFEQVVRDLSNALLRTHARSAIILDDTVPEDAYSAYRDGPASGQFRKIDRMPEIRGWQGDVYKTVFYIHDFLPGLNYRTITSEGNPQTLVWRAKGTKRTPVFNDLERISRLSYFALRGEYWSVLQTATEAEAFALCFEEIAGL